LHATGQFIARESLHAGFVTRLRINDPFVAQAFLFFEGGDFGAVFSRFAQGGGKAFAIGARDQR
jgi:hypothetical protein